MNGCGLFKKIYPSSLDRLHWTLIYCTWMLYVMSYKSARFDIFKPCLWLEVQWHTFWPDLIKTMSLTHSVKTNLWISGLLSCSLLLVVLHCQFFFKLRTEPCSWLAASFLPQRCLQAAAVSPCTCCLWGIFEMHCMSDFSTCRLLCVNI